MLISRFEQDGTIYDIQPPIVVPDDLQIKSIGHLASYGFEGMEIPATLSPSNAPCLKPEQQIAELNKLEKLNENTRKMYQRLYDREIKENQRYGLLALNNTMNLSGLRHIITVIS